MKEIRSVSFDTSFLLKRNPDVDKVLKELKRDSISCFVTSTVISELDSLKLYDRIDEQIFNLATSRWKRVGGRIIKFKNPFLSTAIRQECIDSMGEHHGVSPEDIVNDCNILVVGLKNGVDLFLSEDFHFTSKITLDVLDEVTNNACSEYHQMCDEEMYCIDAKTFLVAYRNRMIDSRIIEDRLQDIRKPSKRLGEQ